MLIVDVCKHVTCDIKGIISYMAAKEVGKMALMVIDKPDDSSTQTKPQLRVLDEDTYLEVGYYNVYTT